MIMKYRLVLLIICVIIWVGQVQTNVKIVKEEPKFWCWTKPPESTKVKKWDPNMGGANWGFCTDPNLALNEKVAYEVTTFTSNIEDAGAKGSFYIQLFGDEGKSEEILLTSEGFSQGSITKTKIQSPRIGTPIKIILKYTGTERFRCVSLRLSQESSFWDFDCSSWLQCPKNCQEEMPLAGKKKYSFKIVTKQGTKAPLYIKIAGLLGDTATKILTESGYESGDVTNVDILAKDVGDICSVKISMTKHDSWQPEEISLKKEEGKQEWNEIKTVIMCPMNCVIILKADCKQAKGGGGGGGGGKEKKKEDNKQQQEVEEQVDPQLLYNNYQGNGLTIQEQTKMENIGCDTVIRDNEEFGGVWMDNRINHELFIVKCPANCDIFGDSKVKGIGIHPDDSSICKSAIIDRAMPVFGGIIGVGVYTGISAYDQGGKMFGIEVAGGAQSDKSFAVVKIDNVDMADLDMRILNHQGLPTYFGRVDFRLDGMWGSVCAKGMTQSAARRICRDLNYKDGKLMNPQEDGEAFCKAIQGENYCGFMTQPIHFQSIQCEGTEQNIMQCNRELAQDQCSHLDDAILECSMINFDVPQEPVDKSVRLMDGSNAVSSSGSGRLEIYMGKWGSICNYDFDDNAAKVGCIQMGYDNGKIIGNVDEQGVCANYNDKNYCGANTPIQMVHVKCTGDEVKLGACGYKTWPFINKCGHQQDVIIQCEGMKGDASSLSQQPLIVPPPPNMGKLPLLPIIKGTCAITLMEPIFRGDPGSIFLIHCPTDCQQAIQSVFGSSIYSQESSICRAAIHAGVLQHFGGLIQVVSTYGQAAYHGTQNRDIHSLNYLTSCRAFIVIKPNTIAIRLAQSFKTREKAKQCQTCKGSSFIFENDDFDGGQLQLSNLNNNNNNRVRLRMSNIGSSFLQARFIFQQKQTGDEDNEGKGKPGSGNFLYRWYPQVGFEFNGLEEDILFLKGSPRESGTSQLKIFSIAVKLELSAANDKELTIVGHSACGGFAFVKSEDNQLVFKKRCGPEFIFNSNYYLGVKQPVSIVITHTLSKTVFYINGAMFNYVNQGSTFVCEKSLDIGSFSDQKDQIWQGTIQYVLIYDRILTQSEIVKLFKQGSQGPSSGIIKGLRHTLDARKCVYPCTTNPTPGQIGSPQPPKDVMLGQPEISDVSTPPSNNKKDEQPNKKDDTKADEGGDDGEGMDQSDADNNNNQDQEEIDNTVGSIEIGCDAKGNDKMFDGPTGKKFRVNCPKKCVEVHTVIIGTMIYSDDSAICSSALHAGIIEKQTGGAVILIIANGQSFYQGSLQNGMQSANRFEHERSITFEVAKKIQQVYKCDVTGQDSQFGGPTDSKFRVVCPQNCSYPPISVYGTETYSDDSAVCQAAIHFGLIGDQGGEVEIQIKDGQKQYKPSSQNGVQSLQKKEFIRSFTFIGSNGKSKGGGDSGNSCEFFKEIYNPVNIFQNWKVVDYVNAENGPSEWSFNKHPEKKEGLLTIEQSSLIKGNFEYYGSYLIHKKFDCPNTLIKANVFFNSTGSRSAIVFRYRDIDNYLALEFNSPSSAPVRIIRKQGTSIKELVALDKFYFYAKVWYRWKILYNEKVIKVFVQNQFIRQTNKVFQTVDDDGVARGSVGVAVDDSADTYFDGLQTMPAFEDYVEKGIDKDDKRTWSQCLGAEKTSKRRSFCQQFYGGYHQGVIKCQALHTFCNICCMKNINVLENILYFNCFRQCIFDAQIKEQSEESKKHEDEDKLKILKGEWVPKENDKIDYQTDEGSPFSKAMIKKIDRSDANNIQLTIETSEKDIIDGIKMEQVKKCGVGLPGRTDCQ